LNEGCPAYCLLYPNDENCVDVPVPEDCTTNPMKRGCPEYCDKNPTDKACKPNDVTCKENPMTKGCPEYCEKNQDDPLCDVDPKDPCK